MATESDLSVLDGISERLRRSGQTKSFGNSVYEFLGDATPQNAPRTISRAVVSMPYDTLLPFLEGVEEAVAGIVENGAVLMVVQIEARTHGATYSVRTVRDMAYPVPAPQVIAVLPHRSYFSDEPYDQDVMAFLKLLLEQGKWLGQKKTRGLLGLIDPGQAGQTA